MVTQGTGLGREGGREQLTCISDEQTAGQERHDASVSGFNITRRRPRMTPQNPCMALLPCACCTVIQ